MMLDNRKQKKGQKVSERVYYVAPNTVECLAYLTLMITPGLLTQMGTLATQVRSTKKYINVVFPTK